MNRRAFLRAGAASTAILWAVPAWCAEERPAAPTDAELLAEARASIGQHRVGKATVRVLDAAGKPLGGVKLRLEQLRHDFLFGCNCFSLGRCANPEHEEQYRRRFATLFNYCTLGFYWASYEMRRGKPGYEYTDQVLEWTRQQAITCKGHPLVWDHPAGSPLWLPSEPDEIAQLVRARVRDLVSHFRGRIDFWDVVNEATHLPDGVNKTGMAAWGAALGPVPYVAGPLKVARAANPVATLLVNDYRTDPQYFEILSRQRDQEGFLLDAIGIQSHMHQGVWPLHKVYSVCETYHKLGLPIHFTETTILSGTRETRTDAWGPTTPQDEAVQAEQAANFYTILFAHPAVRAITWWDFSDYHAWQRAPAGLLRDDMTPKPVYERLLDLVKNKWWTTAEHRTDETGSAAFAGCFGHYRVSAELAINRTATHEFQLQRAQPNQITLRM